MSKNITLIRIPIYFATSVGAAIATAATLTLSSTVTSKPFLALIFVGVFFVCAKLVEETLMKVINSSTWIRRLLLGKDFIEGWWVESLELLHNVTGQPDASTSDFVIAVIRFDDGEYTVEGYWLDISGNFKGSWASSFSTYKDGCLEYIFQGPWLAGAKPYTNNGYARIKFLRDTTSSPPEYFEGEVVNIGPDFNQAYFTGRKVASEIIKSTRGLSIRNRAIEIRKHIEQHQP